MCTRPSRHLPFLAPPPPAPRFLLSLSPGVRTLHHCAFAQAVPLPTMSFTCIFHPQPVSPYNAPPHKSCPITWASRIRLVLNQPSGLT